MNLLKKSPLLVLGLVLFAACKKDTIDNPVTPVVQPVDTSSIATQWWNDAVFYEIFVRSFYDQNGDGKGDFKGLIQKLDYLNDGNPATTTDLGITAIWLMPIMQSPSYHGYDVTDFRTIESDYGNNADFKTFIAAAHQRGIRVIIDYVMNHTSDQHPWFSQSASGPASPYRNWYRWNTTYPGNNWHNRNSAWYYGFFYSGMPDLNYESDSVKNEMYDIARFWLQDMNVDGFRLDAAKFLYETPTQIEDAPATLQFWQDFSTFNKSIKADAITVGEVWSSVDKVVPYIQNNRLDMCFEFDLAGTIINSVNAGDASNLKNKINAVITSYPALKYATFLTNHDQDRVMNMFGNDEFKAKLAAQILLTLPGVPYIYYGEEIGMVGVKPDENIRTPMQWSGGANAGFTTGTPWRNPQADYSVKNIAAQQQNAGSLWNTYRKMIEIRNNENALRRGYYTPVFSSPENALVFLRRYKSEAVIVAANVSNAPIDNLTITLNSGSIAAGDYTLTDLISGSVQNLTVNINGGFNATNIGPLPRRSTAVYKLRKK